MLTNRKKTRNSATLIPIYVDMSIHTSRNHEGGAWLAVLDFIRSLFADHYVEDHIVSMLHSYGTDLSEIADSLFNVVFYDSVVC